MSTFFHREIIFQLGYNSGHIANPFSPSFSPSFGIPCPRSSNVAKINNQKILDPLWSVSMTQSQGMLIANRFIDFPYL